MSGHYATLLRGTVEAILPHFDVYITDWADARMVPLAVGTFDLDDYIDYLREMLAHLGPGVHTIGVCQPSVPLLAAAAMMEADGDRNAPASMTLMGGPVDTRRSPTEVNKLAEQRGVEWFRRNCLHPVPFPYLGFGREVYPGFLQLTGFMAMNLDRHVNAHLDMFNHLVDGDGDSAEKHRDFYDEYLAVMDLAAEYYMQTVETVFMRHALPKGEMRHRGQLVDLTAIRNCGLLTVEGEKDDISGVGQTYAAHELCVNIPRAKKAPSPAEGRPLRRVQRVPLPARDRAAHSPVHRWNNRASQSSRPSPTARAIQTTPKLRHRTGPARLIIRPIPPKARFRGC